MELTDEIKSDLLSQCTSGYEWKDEMLEHTKPLHSLNGILDFDSFYSIVKTWEVSRPVVITFLSKEYLSVGEIWISKMKQTSTKQYLIIATDEETKFFLDSTHEPNCRVWLDESAHSSLSFLSRTGFTEKGLSVTAVKFPVVREILKINFDVFLMDIDALLLSNLPFSFFSKIDVAFQRVVYFPEPIARVWKFAACSGFIWFKSNKKTIELLNNVIEEQLKVYSDQLAFNIALWKSKIKWRYSNNSEKGQTEKLDTKDFFIENHKKKIFGIAETRGIKFCALPTYSFWRNDFIPFNPINILVFHPNSPKSSEGKIQMFKKYNLI